METVEINAWEFLPSFVSDRPAQNDAPTAIPAQNSVVNITPPAIPAQNSVVNNTPPAVPAQNVIVNNTPPAVPAQNVVVNNRSQVISTENSSYVSNRPKSTESPGGVECFVAKPTNISGKWQVSFTVNIEQLIAPQEAVNDKADESTTLERIRPFPKAPPRKATNIRRRRTCEILTDTPVKEAIELRRQERTAKKSKRALILDSNEMSKKKTSRKSRTQKTAKSASSAPKDWNCLECNQPWSESTTSWVQCMACLLWAHIPCAEDPDLYVCSSCCSG
jgi:hypothetical protein